MYRIDNSTAATSIPTPEAPGPIEPGWFTNGSPESGEAATIVDADWMNAVQEEISYVIEQNALTLSKTDRTQLWQALQRMTRIKATGAVTVYVSANSGSDTNDGLTASTPFRNINTGVNYMLNNIDLASKYQATVMIEGGTYNEIVTIIGKPMGVIDVTQFQLQTHNGQVAINSVNGGGTINVNVGGLITLNGNFLLSANTGPDDVPSVINVGMGSLVNVMSNIQFGNSPGCSHITAGLGGTLWMTGPTGYSIVGSAARHVNASMGGAIQLNSVSGYGGPITLVNSPNFTDCFANAVDGGACIFNSVLFTGTSATGKKFNAATNGVIQTQGSGVSFLPGNVAGTTASGGQYA
jgi:hypothetical protein